MAEPYSIEAPELMAIQPLVSVLVQTYQHAPYIKKCLEGILMQETDFPFEIVVGEDESSDGTREICIQYQKRYPEKIRLFLRSRGDVIFINGAATGRYNFIENLKVARGKYIALCDGDDYWIDKYKLQKQVKALNEDSGVTIVGGNYLTEVNGELLDETTHLGDTPSIHRYYTLNDTLLSAQFGTSTACFRNDFSAIPFSLALSPLMDYALWNWALFNSGGKALVLPDYISVYRITGKGVYTMYDRIRQGINVIRTLERLDEAMEFKHHRQIQIAIMRRLKNMAWYGENDSVKSYRSSVRREFLRFFFKQRTERILILRTYGWRTIKGLVIG